MFELGIIPHCWWLLTKLVVSFLSQHRIELDAELNNRLERNDVSECDESDATLWV